MNIDINKVNLSEKDIEDWLYENPKAANVWWLEGLEWIGRQYQLPSGIADIVGKSKGGFVIVVEVKNVPINKAAVLQVCRYAADLERVLHFRADYPERGRYNFPFVYRLLVGPSIDSQTFIEARACNVDVLLFSAQVSLTIGEAKPHATYYDNLNDHCQAIAMRDEFEEFGDLVGFRKDQYDELMDAISNDEEANDG